MDEKTMKKIEELRAEYRRSRVIPPVKTPMVWAAEEVDGDILVVQLETGADRKAWIAEDREHRFKLSRAEARKIMVTQLDECGWSDDHTVLERRGLPHMGSAFIYDQYTEYVTD